MPEESDITVIDDSGLLGLVDCSTYRSFVGADWDYEQLVSHFCDQMKRQAILVWECGDGGDSYLVRVRRKSTNQKGYREIVGGIRATTNRLYLSSYTALTMAAQFEDEDLPSKDEQEQAVELAPGLYKVRIVQMYDPEKAGNLDEGEPHFLLELEPGQSETWPNVAWLST